MKNIFKLIKHMIMSIFMTIVLSMSMMIGSILIDGELDKDFSFWVSLLMGHVYLWAAMLSEE